MKRRAQARRFFLLTINVLLAPMPELTDNSQNVTEARGWSDYWREDGATGEVFIGKDGSTNPHLDAFWSAHLQRLAAQSTVIDIASGAGSVFKHIPKDRNTELVASDLSTEALSLLAQRTPESICVAASADALPFADGVFDCVVSQFGIEYAGERAFAEAGRIVAAGGRLIALCHIEDGYIDSKNKQLLAGAMLTRDLDFIPLAASLTRAAFGDGNFEATAHAFQPAERALAAFVASHPDGFHAHLYRGFRQLFEHHRQYALQDITGWLDAMATDLGRNIMRLESMRAAALSPPAIERIRRDLDVAGISTTATPFELPGHGKPVAWQILGSRTPAGDL